MPFHAASVLASLPCTCSKPLPAADWLRCCCRRLPLLPQRLWATLAANRLNMVPALNFLIERGLKENAATKDPTAVAATGKEVRRSSSSGACPHGFAHPRKAPPAGRPSVVPHCPWRVPRCLQMT